MKPGIMVSSGLALASLGDSFLYVYLPASYTSLGISALWVGILLSVNRFARLFFNGWVALNISRHGIRSATVAAAGIAMISTFSYGFISSAFLWLIARAAWGLAFSTLRLSSLVYAVQHPKKGFSIGVSKGIIALGPIIALLIGPLLLAGLDRFYTFLVMALIGIIALLLALKLPKIQFEEMTRRDLLLSWPSAFNVLVLLNAVVEAMIVVLAGKVLFPGLTDSGTMLVTVGFFLAYKRVCLVAFSPLAGWLADKWGFDHLFNYTSIATIVGLVFVVFGFGAAGLIISFTFSAMNASVSPGGALKNDRYLLKEFSDNATWRDIGTAAGTFTGALFLGYSSIEAVFASFGIILLAGLALHYHAKTNRNYGNS